ncbi:MAG TPA: rRNA maturation RNase YbeY [Thermoguttaceae bacterium]|nr:rRNA maturation RNase YbeY [Thermoguttaceae bacterium]
MTEAPRELIIEVNDEQSQLPEDGRLVEAVRSILEEAAINRARISVAIVDDPTIQQVHRDYLQIDEPTDVMSFVLEQTDDLLEGEVIASADTAIASAPQFGLSAGDELLLYVIHGTLHLVGFDDLTPEKQAEMRRQERAHLARFDVELPDQRTDDKEGGTS